MELILGDTPNNLPYLLHSITQSVINMKSKYYFFYLQLGSKNPNDYRVYAFINVSHIPTNKLIEIFNIDINKDPHISKGYFLNKTICRKHKKYISDEIGQINLDLFQYVLEYYVADDDKSIRKLYKKSLLE